MALIKLAGFLVGLRFGASLWGFAFGLRLRASPSGFAFGPARTHDSTQNPWAMPGVVPGFPTKHPRHTAVVFAAENRRAVFWCASCATRSDPPHDAPAQHAPEVPVPGCGPPTQAHRAVLTRRHPSPFWRCGLEPARSFALLWRRLPLLVVIITFFPGKLNNKQFS